MKRMMMVAAGLGLASMGLVACMEPQVAPDLPAPDMSRLDVSELAGGLSTPWSVMPLPDGGAIVAEKAGRIVRVSTDGSVADVSGGPTPYYVASGNSQAGLFDIVPANDFADTGNVFISSAYGTAEANGTALYAARLNGVRLEGLTEIFRSTPKDTNAHYGAKVVPLPDGTVAMSTGDGFVYREQAQDTSNTMGKVVRVGADGSIPADNPFGNAVWSFGHRNVQGLALDRVTGELWEHEHGPRGGDELNLIEAGNNYGWPLVTTGTDYNGLRISPFETSDDYAGFVHDWTPSIAPAGLVIYRGDMFPEWQGDAIVGALAGQSVRRVDLEDGASVGESILFRTRRVPGEGESADDTGWSRIRDVREAADGSLYVITNEGDRSRLLRIARRATPS